MAQVTAIGKVIRYSTGNTPRGDNYLFGTLQEGRMFHNFSLFGPDAERFQEEVGEGHIILIVGDLRYRADDRYKNDKGKSAFTAQFMPRYWERAMDVSGEEEEEREAPF